MFLSRRSQAKAARTRRRVHCLGVVPEVLHPRKSTLCRIVNCGRSPHHKCCTQKQEELQEVITTTESAVTETTQELSMFENATLRDGGVEEDFSATESITLKVEAKDDESVDKSMTNVIM